MGWRSLYRRSRRTPSEPPPDEDSELERFFTDAEEARNRFRELIESLAERLFALAGIIAPASAGKARQITEGGA